MLKASYGKVEHQTQVFNMLSLFQAGLFMWFQGIVIDSF